MREKLIEQIKRHEGFRQFPYVDTVGKLTVGYGRNLEDKGITRDEAEVLLKSDLNSIEVVLHELAPWYVDLDEVRQDAILNMAFNMGVHGLFGFRRMIAALKIKDYQEVYNQALDSRWADQVGPRARELALQLKTGEYML